MYTRDAWLFEVQGHFYYFSHLLTCCPPFSYMIGDEAHIFWIWVCLVVQPLSKSASWSQCLSPCAHLCLSFKDLVPSKHSLLSLYCLLLPLPHYSCQFGTLPFGWTLTSLCVHTHALLPCACYITPGPHAQGFVALLATPTRSIRVFKSARSGIPARLHASINSLARQSGCCETWLRRR